MNAELVPFLQMLCVLDNRTLAECMRITGKGYSTVKRHITVARRLGMRIECDRMTGYRYQVVDTGPFDLLKLRRVRFPLEANVLRRVA